MANLTRNRTTSGVEMNSSRDYSNDVLRSAFWVWAHLGSTILFNTLLYISLRAFGYSENVSVSIVSITSILSILVPFLAFPKPTQAQARFHIAVVRVFPSLVLLGAIATSAAYLANPSIHKDINVIPTPSIINHPSTPTVTATVTSTVSPTIMPTVTSTQSNATSTPALPTILITATNLPNGFRIGTWHDDSIICDTNPKHYLVKIYGVEIIGGTPPYEVTFSQSGNIIKPKNYLTDRGIEFIEPVIVRKDAYVHVVITFSSANGDSTWSGYLLYPYKYDQRCPVP